jgi:hypothetical protein
MPPVPEESPTLNGSTDPQIGSSVPKLGILLLLLRRSFERTSTLRGCPAQLPNEAESSSLSGIRQGKTFYGRFSWGEAVAGLLYPDGRILSLALRVQARSEISPTDALFSHNRQISGVFSAIS